MYNLHTRHMQQETGGSKDGSTRRSSKKVAHPCDRQRCPHHHRQWSARTGTVTGAGPQRPCRRPCQPEKSFRNNMPTTNQMHTQRAAHFTNSAHFDLNLLEFNRRRAGTGLGASLAFRLRLEPTERQQLRIDERTTERHAHASTRQASGSTGQQAAAPARRHDVGRQAAKRSDENPWQQMARRPCTTRSRITLKSVRWVAGRSAQAALLTVACCPPQLPLRTQGRSHFSERSKGKA
jgi:hypothetical protein